MTIPTETAVNLALAYYRANGNKCTRHLGEFLHPDARLIGPLGEVAGKESVLEAVTGFATLFKSLRVNASFGSENQASRKTDSYGVCIGGGKGPLTWVVEDQSAGDREWCPSEK